MAKKKIRYVCNNCGHQALQWLGKCPSCDEWNTFTEELVESGKKSSKTINIEVEATKLNEIIETEEPRIITGILEFDRVLGGGIIPGSVVLIGGDPGIGKSTLVMQAAAKIPGKILYVTGEESKRQISLRAKRLKINSDSLYLITETDIDLINKAINELAPDVVVIDSIQTMQKSDYDNAPGTVTQIRECTVDLMRTAKTKNCAVIIVGHVTKEGVIAGPKILEHIVDTVLNLEGEKNYSYRILRAQKNRFGSTNELGIFEMREEGLVEVLNPSEVFLSERGKEIPGSVVTSCIEGTRPILMEVQALVTPSNYGNPQRVATGFDYRRLSILLAVLEKRAGLRLSSYNVFLNMAGGLRIDEPAVDLAVCSAIASSYLDKPAHSNIVVLGEIGLGGEVRSISNIEKRIQESDKLGFKSVVIPQNNIKSIKNKKGLDLQSVENIVDALSLILKQ